MNEQPTPSPEEGLAAAMESLFSDPATRERFEEMVRNLRANLPANGEKTSQESDPPPAGDVPASAPADGLAAILSNPTLMANLPNLLAGMRPAPAPVPAREKSPEDRRRDLLLALKPFLSKDRENAVDLILQISRLGAVLRMMR